jgi:spermidine synthase
VDGEEENCSNFMKILEENTSKYNGTIKVIRDFIWGNRIVVKNLTQSGGILFEVWQATLRKLKNKNIQTCLILGLGGGSAAKIVNKNWPNAKITGIDIDEKMVQLGKKYLGLNKFEIDICIIDAMKFVQKENRIYDLILVDLYCGDRFPEKFEDEKFLKNIQKLLSKNGLVVFNRLWGKENKVSSLKFGKKLEKVFGKVETFMPRANVMFLCGS